MSINKTTIYSNLREEIVSKINESVSSHFEVEATQDLSGKKNIICADINDEFECESCLYVLNEIDYDQKHKTQITIDALSNSKILVKSIERLFGADHSVKLDSSYEFDSLKVFKITSLFSIGYYTDLIMLKAYEKGFDHKVIGTQVNDILRSYMFSLSLSAVEIEMIFTKNELILQIMAVKSKLAENDMLSLNHSSVDSSLYSVCYVENTNQIITTVTYEKEKSYSAVLIFDYINRAQNAVNPNYKVEEIIIDHKVVIPGESNKKVSISDLKDIVSFMKSHDLTPDNFDTYLKSYSNQNVVDQLKDDEIKFIKKSVLDENVKEKLEKSLKKQIDKSFESSKNEEFVDNFFSKIDYNTLKDMIKVDNWNEDEKEIKKRVLEYIKDKKDLTYNDFVNEVQTYLISNVELKQEDFKVIKKQVEAKIIDEQCVKEDISSKDLIHQFEMDELRSKVDKMRELYTRLKTMINQSNDRVLPDETEVLDDTDDNSGKILVMQKQIEELDEQNKQLQCELGLKNNQIELMSQKVDKANSSSSENKQDFHEIKKKYEDALVRNEKLEKEIKRLEVSKIGDGDKAKVDELISKLKEADIEIKMHKQRLKFANSQVQNLEKAKNHASKGGAQNKKIAFMEKQMDKQKEIKAKLDKEIAVYKKDLHKATQDNKILNNKIKELSREAAKKNKKVA